MIQKLRIKDFKNISEEEFSLCPLTILTGLNSTGKSSILQSILLLNKETTRNGGRFLDNIPSQFETLRNIYQNAKEICIDLIRDDVSINYRMGIDFKEIPETCAGLEYEKNLFYLSANRLGVENDATISQDLYCGIDGRFLFGTYDKEKSSPVLSDLVKDKQSLTLAAQVNYWLVYILNLPMELNTEQRDSQKVEIKYKSDNIPYILPSQLGAGVSYLTKILILCLRAKKGHTIMIENPEIHLHPAAQARLGEFFSFISQAGIQLLIETHCENLINRLRYEVYKNTISPENVIIF